MPNCGGLSILPDVIRARRTPLHEPPLIRLRSFTRWKLLDLSADVEILDSAHNELRVVILTLRVLKLRIVPHIHQLPQHEPLVATVKIIQIRKMFEIGNAAVPSEEVGEIVRYR